MADSSPFQGLEEDMDADLAAAIAMSLGGEDVGVGVGEGDGEGEGTLEQHVAVPVPVSGLQEDASHGDASASGGAHGASASASMFASADMDYELQAAIALSLGQQPPPPPQPQPPHANASASANANPQPASQQQQQQQQQQQHARVRSSTKRARAPPQEYAPPPTLPAWMQAASDQPESAPVDDAALAALSTAMGVQMASSSATPSPNSLLLPSTAGAVTKRQMESTVRALLSKRRTLAQGMPETRILALVHGRAVAQMRSADVPLVRLAAYTAASILTELLASDDEEDLFFEGGQHRHVFRDLLTSAQASEALIADMVAVTSVSSSAELEKFWRDLLVSSLKDFNDVPLDDLASVDSRLYAVSTLISSPAILRLLGKELHAEVSRAHTITGLEFEKRSVLAPLLKVGTLPTTPNGPTPSAATKTFLSLRGYPKSGERERIINNLASVFERTHGAAHTMLRMLAGAGPDYKETVLAWLAAAVGTSQARTKIGASTAAASLARGALAGSSDAFALGVAATCLRFCRPFLDGKPQHLARLREAPLTQPRRLSSPAGEGTLAGRAAAPSSIALPSPPSTPFFAPRLAETMQPPHFVVEVFLLAQQATQICVMPAAISFVRRLRAKERHSKREGLDLNADPEWNAECDCGSAQLLDPSMAVDMCRLSLITAVWLMSLLDHPNPEAVREAYACIPESVAKNLGMWVTHVLRWNRADLLAGAGSTALPVTVLVECATALLLRRDLVRSPIVHARLTEMLENFLRSTRHGARSLGTGAGSSAHDALVGAVLGNADVLRRIVPALMSAYVAMDAVEGIDVDAEDFDKFASRNDAARLIETIWEYPECCASISELLATQNGRDLFAQFASAALGALMYLLEDSLERLVSIHEMETAMADEAKWKALPPAERADKESFLRSQEGAAKGFMVYARTTLRLLNLLADAQGVGEAFLHETTVGPAAYAVVHFLELLVGPKGSNLQVKKPERFHFRPNELLLSIVEFALRIATRHSAGGAFAAAVAAEPDFDAAILRKAGSTMKQENLGGPRHHECLDDLINAAQARKGGASGASAAAAAAAGGGEGSEAAAASHAIPSFADEASDDADGMWRRRYESTMGQLAFADVDGGLPQYYGLFEDLANQPAGNEKQKLRKLAKEVQSLSASGGLPVALESSVLLRQDGARPDKMRALIVGPEGTPYALGCFVFDIFFPSDYPHKPPMVQFVTTGGGRIRFNPNLYADGKVCLSLLGTWHGGAEFEKWNPSQSSLYQVLVSIQAMILVDEPWFNEPGADGLRGTDDGDRKSREYNEEIRLQTVRWAMVAQLRKPKPGFEDAIRAHFALQRGRIYRQVAGWVDACEDATRKARMQESMHELVDELSKLQEP